MASHKPPEKAIKQAKKKRELKDKRKNKQRFVCIVFVMLITALCIRIGYIQIVYGESSTRMALANAASLGNNREIRPNRGGIMDRNLDPLAISITVYSVIFDARLLSQQTPEVQENTIKGLANILTWLNEEDLWRLLSRDEEGKLIYDRNFIEIAKQVPYQEAMEIQRDPNIRCIFLVEDTKRSYLHNNLASHVIGFTRGEAVWGLERQYNSFMTGSPGRVFRTYDSRGNPFDNVINPVDGFTVITTIDRHIQQIAEDMCQKIGRMHEPVNVSIIVMDPNTAEVLAMAGYPSFNLNEPDNIEHIAYHRIQEQWDYMERNEQINLLNRVWRNRNITASIEPGSTFKPIVIAAALEENIITYYNPATYFCSGFKRFAELEDPIRCWAWRAGGHGNQTLSQVIANSCNVAMMDIAAMMGRNIFHKYQRDFGFGERTGIDLPGEESFSALVYSLNQLNATELATSSFGQGFNCSPIQAINSFSALINGGNLMRPYVVSRIVDRNGNIIAENRPAISRRVISRQTSDYLRESMVSVITEGTGRRAAIEGYNVGGKTGTGEQGVRGDEEWAYSFIAYLPAENPEIIAMLIIDRPRDNDAYESSGMTVVPLLRETLVEIINYRNIRPSDPNVRIADIMRAPDAIKLENLVKLTTAEAIIRLNRQNLDFQIIGAGGKYITGQFPTAGMDIDKNATVFLYTSNGDEGLVSVPDIINLTQEQAVDILQKAGFVPMIIVDESTSLSAEGPNGEVLLKEPDFLVIHQLPSAGVQLEQGTQIRIVVRG